MHEDWLACPFCGDDGEKSEVEMTVFPSPNQYKVIRCQTCGASCPWMNWNMRAGQQMVATAPAPTFADWQALHDSLPQAGATEQEIAEALAVCDETGAEMLAGAIGKATAHQP
ncbi:hypothetical protein [Cupriavidus gilardii]|uniref:Uncharacterized protein n=1 Tax=Cupriavidus gilardii TaxID=82541 RepID=A0A849BI51_9BURK|nr:hypothetical protein [Cupriavidus gilardii]QQE07788.1 hypothetical protein IC580_05485 [Cupriavidus sp. ISTL7]KAB0594334.1 hypothetical protein F7Q96_22015 [Cupriavidus gilardii]MCT9015864.1 hypothetical protein [Cupriavidus gilardii]MCT9055388.1 hypothetical protein [Cupriavidus gilardii]NNH13728.1 hypothetical protein [Cupriavidus gilardii]